MTHKQPGEIECSFLLSLLYKVVIRMQLYKMIFICEIVYVPVFCSHKIYL